MVAMRAPCLQDLTVSRTQVHCPSSIPDLCLLHLLRFACYLLPVPPSKEVHNEGGVIRSPSGNGNPGGIPVIDPSFASSSFVQSICCLSRTWNASLIQQEFIAHNTRLIGPCSHLMCCMLPAVHISVVSRSTCSTAVYICGLSGSRAHLHRGRESLANIAALTVTPRTPQVPHHHSLPHTPRLNSIRHHTPSKHLNKSLTRAEITYLRFWSAVFRSMT